MSFEAIKDNNKDLFNESVIKLKEYFNDKEGYEWFFNEVDCLSKGISKNYELKNKLEYANYVSLIRLKEISESSSISDKIIRFTLLSEYLLNDGKRVVFIDRKKWNKYFNEDNLEDEIFSNFLEIIKTKYDENTWKLEDMREVFNSFYKKDENLADVYSLLNTKKVFEL